MKKTNNIIVRERYGFFLTQEAAGLEPKKELKVANTTPFNSPASGGHWMQTFPILKFLNYLKLLWKGYAERQDYRKEVQKRLLKQRALKREQASTPPSTPLRMTLLRMTVRSLTGEHWTDRFLRLKAESFTLILSCYNSTLGSRNVFGMTNQGLEVTNWTLEMTKLRSRNVFGMTKLGFGVIKLGFEMTKWSYGMTKRSLAMAALLLLMVSFGATAQDTIRPLKIGDSVPDITLENVQNYTGNTLKLSDFKGKLVILDFWATWCGSCVSKLAEDEEIQRNFFEQLLFVLVDSKNTGEDAAQALKFIDKWQNTHQIKLTSPFIMEDSILMNYFPHQLLPHYVWIDGYGSVRAITGRDQITQRLISKALKEDSYPVTLKTN